MLVGTVSIEASEALSSLLKRHRVPHEVLNAKFHEKEAEIIAQAGKYKAVTIATNMAGRGTDIILGGNPEFLAKREMRQQGFTDEILAEVTGVNETDDAELIEARRSMRIYTKNMSGRPGWNGKRLLSWAGCILSEPNAMKADGLTIS